MNTLFKTATFFFFFISSSLFTNPDLALKAFSEVPHENIGVAHITEAEVDLFESNVPLIHVLQHKYWSYRSWYDYSGNSLKDSIYVVLRLKAASTIDRSLDIPSIIYPFHSFL